MKRIKCSYCGKPFTQDITSQLGAESDSFRDPAYPTLCGWHTQVVKGGLKIQEHLERRINND